MSETIVPCAGRKYKVKIGDKIVLVRVERAWEVQNARGEYQRRCDVTEIATKKRRTLRTISGFIEEVDAPPKQEDEQGSDPSPAPTARAATSVSSELATAQPALGRDVSSYSPTAAQSAERSVPAPTNSKRRAPATPKQKEALFRSINHKAPEPKPEVPKLGLKAKLDAAKLDAEKQKAPTSPPQNASTQSLGRTPTPEQQRILEAGASFRGRLVIEAGAGTGKTTTLSMLAQVKKGRGQYTAFNSPLVKESKSKFPGSISCNTTHSLAFREVGCLFQHRLEGRRMKSSEVAHRLGIEDFTYDHPEGEKRVIPYPLLAAYTMGALRKFRQSADREITTQHFPYIDGIDAPNDVGKRTYQNNELVRDYLLLFARKFWQDISNVKGSLPFTHDDYVKLWQLGTGASKPTIYSDYILLDEAQDTAEVFLDILRQQRAPLILVGDSAQQIYEWRGAVNAMQSFPEAPRLFLSQSFRFGQAIADIANAILDTLDEQTALRLQGLESIPSRVSSQEISNPRAILCRTNAKAVGTVLTKLYEGQTPFLIGGGAEVIAFVDAAKQLQSGRSVTHPDLACFATWGEVQNYVKESDGEDLKVLVKLIDEFGCDPILAALRAMPTDEKLADVVVSTAHKSKGREWESVQLADDFPSRGKSTDADRKLLYVAATRAKLVLDYSRCAFLNPDAEKEKA